MKIVDKLSKQNLKDSKNKTRERVIALAKDVIEVDEKRLEYELTLLNDKLDITEEIVRAKSHTDYFTKCMKEKELSGRRLNFLTQELNREINTMASKSNNSKISQYVVEMKEELEKIREQFHVPLVDRLELREFLRGFSVMRKVVVAVGDVLALDLDGR